MRKLRVPTIGIGTTRYPDGVKVTLTDQPCTEAQARAWLNHVLDTSREALRIYVKVPLTEGQEAALLSFVYNLGVGALTSSTLLRKLNQRDYIGAAYEFGRWDHAGGKVCEPLTRRRAAEAALFRGTAP